MTNKTCYKPETELTFDTVIAERSHVFEHISKDKSGHFCLDLTAVTHCDSAGLALLIEAKKLCRQHKKTFEMVGMPEETRALAVFCGVEAIVQGDEHRV